MMGGLFTGGLLAAAETAGTLTAREFDWPESPLGWLVLVGGGLAVAAWVVWWYVRDTVEVSRVWRVVLSGLRLAVLGGLLVVALNPQDRTQKLSYHPSRVAFLVDTSLSMRHPAKTGDGSSTPAGGPSRAAVVQDLFERTPVLAELRKQHEVSVYTFDSALEGPQRVFGWTPETPPEGMAPSTSNGPEPAATWSDWLEPRGLESRLGETLNELIRQLAGRTLSGIVVISDGASNAGIDPTTAHDRAISSKTRLVTIGVGSTEAPVNLAVSDIQTPTDVQLGDPFEITAFLQAQGFVGKSVQVELLAKSDRDAEPALVEEQEATLGQDGVPVEVKFPQNPTQAGKVQYVVRVKTVGGQIEANHEDNQQSVSVNVFDRPTRVLLVAGGPQRDYQFVRNMLFRHKSIEVDVYLQTAEAGTSQESRNLLFAFPETREQLFEYDVIIAFDPDWKKVPAASREMLSEWVFNEAGGLVLVAGEVYTAQLAQSANPDATDGADDLSPLREMSPVLLTSYISAAQFDQPHDQPWPIQFTPEGQRAGFLQLTDNPVTSVARWKDFPGFYRCFPTNGAKAGATILARLADPRSTAEAQILMASQFYGQGRTFYLGSAEMWRLRAIDENDYDRFWIKTIREAGQGRMKRGTRRGMLLPENRRLVLGQTARVRARLLDARFQPLESDAVTLDVTDPTGRPLVPARKLARDASRPGEYTGDFRASLPGVYKLELEVPESRDQITEEITVVLPKLEDENIRQNSRLLTDLAAETGGSYLTIDEAATKLAGLLPSKGEPFLVDERLRTLWDRSWVMYLLVALLSLEWLIRKLLKLA